MSGFLNEEHVWLLTVVVVDLDFILSWDFVWKVVVLTSVSCIPLFILKYIRWRFAPPTYSKLTWDIVMFISFVVASPEGLYWFLTLKGNVLHQWESNCIFCTVFGILGQGYITIKVKFGAMHMSHVPSFNPISEAGWVQLSCWFAVTFWCIWFLVNIGATLVCVHVWYSSMLLFFANDVIFWKQLLDLINHL